MTCKNCDNETDPTAATATLKTIRALWGVDINGNYSQKPQRDDSLITALYNDDRHCIVHESSNWGIPNFTPQAVQVRQLMLTALGGWLDGVLQVSRQSLENAKLTGSLNLLKWSHLATLGRDHYVQVVYAGNIFPFGHEASLVRITQRTPKSNYAVNLQLFFIVITELEKKYNPIDAANQFNSFPYSTIKFVTAATPSIDTPQRFCTTLTDKQNDHQFIPQVNKTPFAFRLIGYDLEGNEVDFEMPLVFVQHGHLSRQKRQSQHAANINGIAQFYNDANQKYIPTSVDLRSQKMALARSQTPGDTHVEALSASFHAAATPSQAPGFRPLVAGMEIFIHAVQAITGATTPQQITLTDDRNNGTVFATLVSPQSVNFDGNSNKTGGSLSPNFSVTAISKLHGAIGGDPTQARNLHFDPATFFDNTAKLFGIIDLGKIIQAVNNAAATLSGNALTSPIPALKTIETADALITQYTWNAASLTSYDFGFVKFQPDSTAPGKLQVATSLYRYKNNTQPDTLIVNSTLDDFSVVIAGLAAVGFNRVGFTTGSNAKVDVTIDLKQPPVRFLGALTFVNELQQFIPASGFSDPPYLDVSATGVETGYTLALPNIQLGLFTLSNVSFGAMVNLPFTGDPMSLQFNFCQKQQPFTLTVSLLGGGGFFAIAFDMHGLLSLEAALEFGAAASLDLGVASGSISVMGGVYYGMSLANGTETSELSGYVRMNGSLSVLGLITVSVQFLLTLAADISSGKVTRIWGQASLTVQVEVFMFSTSVNLQIEREFPGAGADPTFEQTISAADWQTYCRSRTAGLNEAQMAKSGRKTPEIRPHDYQPLKYIDSHVTKYHRHLPSLERLHEEQMDALRRGQHSTRCQRRRHPLAGYPDILHWMDRLQGALFYIQWNNDKPVETAVTTANWDPTLYQNLFQPGIIVKPFTIPDLSRMVLKSYPAGHIRDFILNTYQEVGNLKPDTLPTAGFYVNDYKKLADISRVQLLQTPTSAGKKSAVDKKSAAGARNAAAANPVPLTDLVSTGHPGTVQARQLITRNKVIAWSPQANTSLDFGQFYHYFGGPYDTATQQPNATAQLPPPPAKPVFDYHSILSVIMDYPIIQRKLGLVLDFELPGPPSAASGFVRIIPAGLAFENELTLSTPPTAYQLTATGFYAASKNGQLD